MHGTELTHIEREQIEIRLRGNWGVRKIARHLQRNHGVIVREIQRNKKPDGVYSALYATEQAVKRRVRRGNVKRKLDKNLELQDWVLFCLMQKAWAPDVIAGHLKIYPPPHLKGVTISPEAIYGWLQEGAGNKLGYWQYLPTKRQRRRKKGSRTKHGIMRIPDRISIHERAHDIAQRQVLGHWESDSIIYPGSGGERISTQQERKARLIKIHRLPSGRSKDTTDALQKTIQSVPCDLVKSITFDNGLEAVGHTQLKRDYGIQTYFCDPYASYQKGSVEHANKLIRRFLPKGTDLRTITDQQIYDIEELLNNTPRKILAYKTPKEVFYKKAS